MGAEATTVEPATAGEALNYVLANFPFQTVLDIGSGGQQHADRFRAAGKQVTCVDSSDHYGRQPDIRGDFNDVLFDDQYDLVWCSHVLEHQLNVNAFLRKVWSVMKPGGVLAITVPPLRQKLVGGHVNTFNAGLLAYNLILAGFDLRDAAVKAYGYNISLICRKRMAQPKGLVMDAGDIERIARFFPFPVHQGCNGSIEEANWTGSPDLRPPAGPVVDFQTISIEQFAQAACPFASDHEALDWAALCVQIPGFVAEFGVFRGTTLRRLAEALPDRALYGFDSFVGLPEAWLRSPTSTYAAGHFGVEALPDVPPTAKLVAGFFSESLPGWLAEHDGPAAMLHIDADLYSSAKDVLWPMNDRILPGCVIVFDELCDWRESGVYPFWPEGEWKALLEWMETFDRKVRVLGRGPLFSGAVVVAE